MHFAGGSHLGTQAAHAHHVIDRDLQGRRQFVPHANASADAGKPLFESRNDLADIRASDFDLRGAAGQVALKLGISATVTDERIAKVLGDEAAIWSVAAANPHNDILRRPEDQAAFRQLMRSLFDRIKAVHGEGVIIHVFPAMPASLAVELGRVWMPKSDLAMTIYDNNRAAGFVPTITIGGE